MGLAWLVLVFGAVDSLLPSCAPWTATPEFAFNPQEPSLFLFNHPIFRRFQVQWYEFDPAFVYEAFGTRVDYSFDCEVDRTATAAFNYRATVPSRMFNCRQHEARLALPPALRPKCGSLLESCV